MNRLVAYGTKGSVSWANASRAARRRGTRFFLVASIGVLLTVAGSATFGQTYPAKGITLIVPSAPGGSTDLAARLVSEPLSKTLGQPVVVENKPGASGNIGSGLVARAQPDGYTLLVQYSGYHTGNPHLFKQLPWDPVKDFAPVGNILLAPHIVVVHPSVPAKDLKELADLARQSPVRSLTPRRGMVRSSTSRARCSRSRSARR